MLDAITEHGGRIDEAMLRYPSAPRPWIDLSTGISPFAWDARAVGAVDLRALPSIPALAELERAAAASFGARDASVMALPGTEIGLRLLATLDLPGPYCHVVPSYRTHAAALGPSRAIDTIADAPPEATILLANPNNPDGRVHDPAELIAFARSRSGWTIVDEAFADVLPGTSIIPHLRVDDRVIIFRSFGKFFGLAGVRLGFVVAPPAILALLRGSLGSWPVSSGAIAIGTAAYADRAWIAAAPARLSTAATALDAVLARHGLTAIGDCPLFRLVDAEHAATLFDRLARNGILVRPFDHAPRWLRFGLPEDAAALERLDRGLAHG